MGKIVLRRRFPNFVCDGMPLGPDEAAYLSEVNSTEEFLELEWVKERYFKEWRVSKHKGTTIGSYDIGRDMLMGIDEEGRHWAIAWILEGELDLPEWEG